MQSGAIMGSRQLYYENHTHLTLRPKYPTFLLGIVLISSHFFYPLYLSSYSNQGMWYDPYFLLIGKWMEGNLSDNHSQNLFTFRLHNREMFSDQILNYIRANLELISGLQSLSYKEMYTPLLHL